MKKTSYLTAALVAFGIAVADAEAARRFGGGGNVGKQRATPTQREATPSQAPAATPAQTAPAQPAAAPSSAAAGSTAAAAAAKPSFMSRWGGLLAGLGIGALLASLFGAQMGPIVGMILAALLAFGVIFLLFRLFAGRKEPAAAPMGRSPQFAGIGSGIRKEPTMGLEADKAPAASGATPVAARPLPYTLPPDIEPQAFLRVAKTSFIRLQAANDAKDLNDIRDFTTPEVYAAVAMQLNERGSEPQKTEVVNLDAQLIDFATEDGYDIASVRFFGLLREQPNVNPEPFDEIWHVRRKAGDKRDPWLIAGIQQNP